LGLGKIFIFRSNGYRPRQELAKGDPFTMRSTKLIITGMACQGCADSLTRLFDKEPGITGASVSYELSAADIEFDPDQVNVERLREIVEVAGFSAG